MSDASSPASFWDVVADAGYHADPYRYLAHFRSERPVLHLGDGTVLLTRYDDVSRALGDSGLGNRAPTQAEPPPSAVSGLAGLAGRDLPLPVTMMDGPRHRAVRRRLASALITDPPAATRAHLERLTHSALAAARRHDDQPVDAVAALAQPVPLALACDDFGIPATDRPQIANWSRALARNTDPAVLVSAASRSTAQRAEVELGRYLARLMVRRRRFPTADLLSRLASPDQDGEEIPLAEAVANAAFLLINGFHNTVNLIANGLLALLRHPDQLDLIRSGEVAVSDAVTELLRYDSPVQSISRTTRRPVSLGGQSVPAGVNVIAMVAAAHRDPEAFTDPDRLDLRRTSTMRLLAFGGGPHYCLGTGIARTEVGFVLAAIIGSFPRLELAAPPSWSQGFTLRGMDSCPVWLNGDPRSRDDRLGPKAPGALSRP